MQREASNRSCISFLHKLPANFRVHVNADSDEFDPNGQFWAVSSTAPINRGISFTWHNATLVPIAIFAVRNVGAPHLNWCYFEQTLSNVLNKL